MIPIEREPEPEILAQKKDEWLAKFLAKRAKDPKERPDFALFESSPASSTRSRTVASPKAAGRSPQTSARSS